MVPPDVLKQGYGPFLSCSLQGKKQEDLALINTQEEHKALWQKRPAGNPVLQLHKSGGEGSGIPADCSPVFHPFSQIAAGNFTMIL